MSDLVALKNELTVDSLGRGYNGVGSENAGPGAMTDAAAAASLNAVNRSRDVSVRDLKKFLFESTHTNAAGPGILWVFIVDVAAGLSIDGGAAPGPNEILSARYVRDIVQNFDGNTALDFTVAQWADATQKLVNAGVMSAAQKATLDALSANQISRGVEIGFGEVREGDVAAARSL